jgi:hypothetical protein
MPRRVLKPWQKFRLVETHQQYTTFGAPFFYEDSRHVFFVSTREERALIFDRLDYGAAADPGLRLDAVIPPLVYAVDPRLEIGPQFWGDGGPVGPDTGIFNADSVRRFVTEDANINLGIAAAGSVMYGDRQIGPAGAILDAKGKI